MSVVAAAIAAMREKGVDPVDILDIVEAIAQAEASAPRARSANAERQARWRARQAEGVTNNVTDNVTGDAKGPSPLVSPPNPPRPLNTPPIIPPTPKVLEGRDAGEFAEWYAIYPHKVGKAAAERAFGKARRKASLQILIDGLNRYILEKPPDRSWCNPATWLNEERWADEPAAPAMKRNSLTDAAIDFQHETRRPRNEPPIRTIPLLT